MTVAKPATATSTPASRGPQLTPAQPRSLIVTIYGMYARQAGGWLAISALVRLLADLGVDEPAVRSSISRLKRQGMLLGERRDGTAGYAISDSARAILREGDQRIFERPTARLADGWLLAVFSVPESERHKRHTMRSRLSWLGFGSASPGVWVAPAHLYDEAREVLERHDLTDYVDLFRADYLAYDDIRAAVRSWWDLTELQAMYGEFLTAYGPVSARWKRRRSVTAADAFADYVPALTAWRRLPFLDPGLAPELLPSNWHGTRAAALFADLRARLEEPARAHVRAVSAVAAG